MKQENVTQCQSLAQIQDKDYDSISSFMYRETGIVLNEAKRAMVVSRLSKRVRELGLSGLTEYCDLLRSKWGGEERTQMISCLTTNITHFYRESGHFDELRELVFPKLIKSAEMGKRVRIWSAGCSTGQEVYSLGVALLGLCPTAADLDIRILGTDLDQSVISEARRGIYSKSQLANVPDRERAFFKVAPGSQNMFEAGAELRRLAAFRVLNLLHEWPMRGPFEVIMCRNVTIYFDQKTQQQLWRRFASFIPAGGRLYVGHSEFRKEQAGEHFEATKLGGFVRTQFPVSPPIGAFPAVLGRNVS